MYSVIPQILSSTFLPKVLLCDVEFCPKVFILEYICTTETFCSFELIAEYIFAMLFLFTYIVS